MELIGFNSKVEIKGKTIGLRERPYVIAEMACAHNGNFEQAKALLKAAHESGADACQLQFFVPEETVTPNHEVFKLLQDISFSVEEWTKLFNYGRELGVDIFVCTYDVPSVALAKKLGADGIKLNSADLSNPDVLKAVAESKIPFTLGTGASTFDEIEKGLKFIFDHGAKNVILMHGVQNFPTKNIDLNIARIELIKNEFRNIPVGYADHTDGEDKFGNIVDLLAIGMGAAVIEKHITLSRKAKGIDYQAALEPDEFKEFVGTIRKAYEAMGALEVKPFSESDLRYRKFQKKSIVAATDMNEGDIITRNKVRFLRNAVPGLSPVDFPLVENKKITKKLSAFDNILPENTV
jgi:sialic acid synthase SpsE